MKIKNRNKYQRREVAWREGEGEGEEEGEGGRGKKNWGKNLDQGVKKVLFYFDVVLRNENKLLIEL